MMKKFFLFLFFLAILPAAHAQQVDSIVVTPSAPVAGDTVRIYIYLSFPAGACADVATSTTSGTDIYGYAFHCMGNFSVLCYDVDTLVFTQLAAGNYTFYFTLDAGYGPPENCTPGFQPYDYDTAYFSVSTVSGTGASAFPSGITIFPNPASGHLTIANPGGGHATVYLMSLTGALVLTEQTMGNLHEIDIAGIAPGTYICKIVSGDFVSAVKLVIR